MLELENLRFRFWETPIEKLFSEIKDSAFPRVEVPYETARKLDHLLERAATFCTWVWDSSEPPLYRARKNEYGQWKPFAKADMGPPPFDMTLVGRAQPAGVSVLYLADAPQTAIAEIKPDADEYVTVASFRIRKESKLKVLDLTQIRGTLLTADPIYSNDLITLSRRAFSAPVHPRDPRKYYAQIYFVQKLRDMGFDGVGYESAVQKKGRCFAFFDGSHFRCTRTKLHEVISVSVNSKMTDFSDLEKQYIANGNTWKKSQ